MLGSCFSRNILTVPTAIYLLTDVLVVSRFGLKRPLNALNVNVTRSQRWWPEPQACPGRAVRLRNLLHRRGVACCAAHKVLAL